MGKFKIAWEKGEERGTERQAHWEGGAILSALKTSSELQVTYLVGGN